MAKQPSLKEGLAKSPGLVSNILRSGTMGTENSLEEITESVRMGTNKSPVAHSEKVKAGLKLRKQFDPEEFAREIERLEGVADRDDEY